MMRPVRVRSECISCARVIYVSSDIRSVPHYGNALRKATREAETHVETSYRLATGGHIAYVLAGTQRVETIRMNCVRCGVATPGIANAKCEACVLRTLEKDYEVPVAQPVQPEPTEHDVVEAMRRYGGSFVDALAKAYQCADSGNRLSIRKAFPKLWDRYVVIARNIKSEAAKSEAAKADESDAQ